MTAVSFFRKHRWIVELAILLTFVVAMCNCVPRPAHAYTLTGASYLSEVDTFVPPQTVFDFVSTSQFIVLPDTVEEYHRSMRVYGFSDKVVLGTSDERTSPVVFWMVGWSIVNDSTVVGTGEACICEWQRRNGEEAVVIWVNESLTFHAYEFWRDTTLIR